MNPFASLSLPLLALIFVTGAAIVWFAGAKLAGYADEIAIRSGWGHAVVGVLLLGAATSLPEIATSTTATLSGRADMAVNNLIGSASFQLVVLAVVDLLIGKAALTTMLPGPRVMLNSVVSIILLLIVTIGVMIGDFAVPVLGVGAFSLLLAAVYVLGLWQLRAEGAATGWKPARLSEEVAEVAPRDNISNSRLGWLILLASAVILVAGGALSLSADGIATQTGLSGGIIGLTLLAAATSLPEFSTAIAAVRLRRAELAIGDIVGGNMFNTVLILLVDAVYRGGPVLRQVDRASMTSALLAILLTALFLFGMVERRDKAVLRMGYDSFAVIVVYTLGVTAIVMGLPGG